MKELVFSIFFISIGFFVSSYLNFKIPLVNNFKQESSNKELKTSELVTYLLQLKIKNILNKNKIKYSDVKINLRSIFLNTLISNKNPSFSAKGDSENYIEVEVLENIESDKVVNFIFQISVFERNNNKNKTHEIVENVPVEFFIDKFKANF